MSGLKPCPFCGHEIRTIVRKSALVGFNGLEMRVERHAFSVRCFACHARGPISSGLVLQGNLPEHLEKLRFIHYTTDDALKEKAINLWNGRTE